MNNSLDYDIPVLKTVDYSFIDEPNKEYSYEKLFDINIQEIQDKEPFINKNDNILFFVFFILIILFVFFVCRKK